MGTDLLTILVLTILIFVSLEFILVIIPALMNRAKVKRKLETPPETSPEIPDILFEPVSTEDRAIMRSWYVERSDSQNFVIKPLAIYPSSVPHDAAPKENSAKTWYIRPEPACPKPEPVKDWKAINKANWRVQRVNEAIRNANRAVREANEANLAEFDWMDSLADIDPHEFVGKK